METIIRAANLGSGSRLLRRPGEPSAVVTAAVPAVPPAVPAVPVVPQPVPALAEAPDGRLLEAEAAARRCAERAERAEARVAELEQRERGREAAAAAADKRLQEELAQARQALKEEADKERADGERRGYADGMTQGERVGREALEQEVQQVRQLATALELARAQVVADAEDLLVEIAFGALCRVLGYEAASRESLSRLVRQVGADALERDALTLRLHPEDAALLGADDAAGVRLVSDAGVVLGGCLIDSATGTLDARLETQLAALSEALQAVRAARRSTGGKT